MDRKTMLELIPDESACLLIDKVLNIEPGKSINAIKNVSNSDIYINNSNPNPCMPDVLLIEAMSQAGYICLLSRSDTELKKISLDGIMSAKFRGKAKPGDLVEITISFESPRPAKSDGKAEAFVDGVLICEAYLQYLIL